MTRKTKLEFGDWQTPPELAAAVLHRLAEECRETPRVVLEPTCGKGSFLVAAAERFPRALLHGLDINPEYVEETQNALSMVRANHSVRQADFFAIDWEKELAGLPDPLWIVGNPPWVTTSRQGALESENTPRRENFKALSGLSALTGKSNFDISEWMLIRLLQSLQGRRAALAVLCKSAVARRMVEYVESSPLRVEPLGMWKIDAGKHFSAAVDAVVLACRTGERRPTSLVWPSYSALDSLRPSARIGVLNGVIVPDVDAFSRTTELAGESPVQWRSGIKHDCSKVMELTESEAGLVNGFGEVVTVESTCLFPMMKSSDLANGGKVPSRYMLVPQRRLSESTNHLQTTAPRTWAYLQKHKEALARRKSSIYVGRDEFAVFGVGDYSFAPFKVAISGLYKRLAFQLVGPVGSSPVVFDDTCYFLPFESRDEAEGAFAALTSEAATDFFKARIFWDSKRPINKDILQALDFGRLLPGHQPRAAGKRKGAVQSALPL